MWTTRVLGCGLRVREKEIVMRWNVISFALVVGVAGLVAWSAPASAQATCMHDTNCTTSGTTCGTDVCSWLTDGGHMCVAASTGDPGWCNGASQAAANNTCKCKGQGATCDMATHHCTFTVPRTDGGTDAATDSGSMPEAGDDGGGAEASAPEAGDDGGAMGDDGGGAGSGATSGSSSGSGTGTSSGSIGGGSGSGSSSGTTGGGDAGTGGGNPSSGGGGGGCSIGSTSASAWGLGTLTIGACMAFVRRRRRS
jgi:hypothetical protein